MEIQRSLGRIEGKLDALLISFSEHVKDDAANFKEVKLQQSIQAKKLATYSGLFLGAWGILTFAKDWLFK